MDSIMKTVGGVIYRTLFAQNLPELIAHVFETGTVETGTVEVRNKLCTARQTWSNLFMAEVLEALDSKMQKIDLLWPYSIKERKMMVQIKEVDNELESMREEIRVLEQQLKPEMCSNQMGPNKRSRTKTPFDEITSKKRAFAANVGNSPLNIEIHANSLCSRSSVLMTPSPDSSENDSNKHDFWLKMNAMCNKKPNSPVLMDHNEELPFLFDSNFKCHNDVAVDIMNTGNKEELLEISTEEHQHQLQTSQSQVSATQTNEMPTMDDETDLELIEPNTTVINLDNYEETTCTVPITVVIKTEPGLEQSLGWEEDNIEEDSELQSGIIIEPKNSPEPLHQTKSSMILSLDGNVEFESIVQRTSKPIKINLLNRKVFEEPKSVPAKATAKIIPDQLELKKSNEWNTPVLSFELKDSLKNVKFREQPIMKKGLEQSGLCSIM